jgi:hypothetical protein
LAYLSLTAVWTPVRRQLESVCDGQLFDRGRYRRHLGLSRGGMGGHRALDELLQFSRNVQARCLYMYVCVFVCVCVYVYVCVCVCVCLFRVSSHSFETVLTIHPHPTRKMVCPKFLLNFTFLIRRLEFRGFRAIVITEASWLLSNCRSILASF